MLRAVVLAIVLATALDIALVGAFAAQTPPDAEAHKAWMNDASDAQEDFREAIAARSGAKAAEAAAKLDDLMKKTEAYWKNKGAADGVKLSHDCQTLAVETGTAAKAGKLDQAQSAFGQLNTACNTCHALHLEKR